MGWAVFPPCCLTWGQTMVGVTVTFQRAFARTVVISAPNPMAATVNPHLCRRLLETPRQVWLSLLWGHCSWVLVHTRFCLCPPRVCFPSPVEVHNQIPLGSNFPGDSQSLCWIPRLGNLLWALELSQQCENSFGITVSSLWVICSVVGLTGHAS